MGAIVKSPGPPLSEGGTAAQTKTPLAEQVGGAVGGTRKGGPQLLIYELPPSGPPPMRDMHYKSVKQIPRKREDI